MRILFASGRGGHIGPLVPFAHACRRAGHDVIVVAPSPAAPLVARAGLDFRPVAEPPDRAKHWAPVFTRGAAPGMVYVIQELFIARAALPAMLAAVEDWRPDLVVRESCEFASCIAAERHDVALAQVGIHLAAQTDADAQLLAIAAPALASLGLDDLDRVARAPVLTCAPRSLEDPAWPEPERVRRFRAGDPGDREPDNLVYVSFGSEAPESPWFPALYRDAAEALAELPVRVLMTVGDRRDPAELGTLPPNVRVERWVSQADVMRHAAAMVGHGGSGSTLIALAAGVPLALIPLFVDGPANAGRVAATGAGLAVDDVTGLKAAVTRLLDDARPRRAARAIADEIAALPPVDAAVDVLAPAH